MYIVKHLLVYRYTLELYCMQYALLVEIEISQANQASPLKLVPSEGPPQTLNF